MNFSIYIFNKVQCLFYFSSSCMLSSAAVCYYYIITITSQTYHTLAQHDRERFIVLFDIKQQESLYK